MTKPWPNLNQEKINKMINRALQACLDYAGGKMTMKQVWHRVRGDRFAVACQKIPEIDLGSELYALNCDFYCYYGCQDEVVHRQILRVAQLLNPKKRKELRH